MLLFQPLGSQSSSRVSIAASLEVSDSIAADNVLCDSMVVAERIGVGARSIEMVNGNLIVSGVPSGAIQLAHSAGNVSVFKPLLVTDTSPNSALVVAGVCEGRCHKRKPYSARNTHNWVETSYSCVESYSRFGNQSCYRCCPHCQMFPCKTPISAICTDVHAASNTSR
ncbi:hypothetical protein BJ741DRAFT_623927 [Chytriomyces cf. hyalinus JEL632]|nr:hypothetical protein BJ741DRAFT_623927 [Chytriomyces cf. hyalinus JEL632]